MSKASEELKLYEAVLALIELKRGETGDESLGADIEELIIAAQFRDLEVDIMQNPGAIEPWLVRRRHVD
jgi:hypothetical protein